MSYFGHVKGRVVVFDGEAPPEGTAVQVEEVKRPVAKDATEPRPAIWDKLLKYAGAAPDLPPDMSVNHDHYIHGTEKRDETVKG